MQELRDMGLQYNFDNRTVSIWSDTIDGLNDFVVEFISEEIPWSLSCAYRKDNMDTIAFI